MDIEDIDQLINTVNNSVPDAVDITDCLRTRIPDASSNTPLNTSSNTSSNVSKTIEELNPINLKTVNDMMKRVISTANNINPLPCPANDANATNNTNTDNNASANISKNVSDNSNSVIKPGTDQQSTITIQNITTIFGYTLPTSTLYFIIALLMIAIGLYFVTSDKRKKKKKEDEDDI